MKAFELAERLGMTAYELMDRMTLPEMLEWIEFDQCHYDQSWIQHAVLCAKIDGATWRKGSPKPDPKKYLPKVKKPKPKRATSVREMKHRFNRALGIITPDMLQ